MLKCYGEGCPIREDCYRFTQPYVKRDAFGKAPYDPVVGGCEYFHSNVPTDDSIREAAYHLWLRSGKPENLALEHWNEASLALCLSTGRAKPAPAPKC